MWVFNIWYYAWYWFWACCNVVREEIAKGRPQEYQQSTTTSQLWVEKNGRSRLMKNSKFVVLSYLVFQPRDARGQHKGVINLKSKRWSNARSSALLWPGHVKGPFPSRANRQTARRCVSVAAFVVRLSPTSSLDPCSEEVPGMHQGVASRYSKRVVPHGFRMFLHFPGKS